jgi:5-methylcytosine-specific restriction endonuclease McrA
MQDYAREFYSSKAWKRCRDGYRSAVGGLCERCLANGRISPAEIIHHKIHITPANINDPSITLSFDNLEALCRKCHGEAHGAQIKRYEVDEFGRVSAL